MTAAPPDIQDRLDHYMKLLRKWQGAINLVSPQSLDEAKERHFADSAQLADFIPPGATVFDLGSGAGFPGLVLAILRPDIKMTLIESDTKKCTFLSTVSRETKTPVSILNQRIESVSRETIPAIITARALAPLDKLLGYARPWAEANPALQMLLLKGEGAPEEVKAAQARYDFNIETHPSRTSKTGQIIRLFDIRAK